MSTHTDTSVTRLRSESPPAAAGRPRRRAVARWLRILVPTAGGLLLLVIIVWPQFRHTEPGFTLSFTDVSNFDDQLRMQALRFEGTDTHGRPFVVTADSATQSTESGSGIKLNDVAANVTMKGDVWLNLESKRGVFEDHKQILTLTGAVSLYSSLGYEVHGSDVVLDLNKSTASSNQALTGQGPLGSFRGGSFSTDLKTERFHVGDGVHMTIYPTAGKG